MAAGFATVVYLIIALVVELAIFIPNNLTIGTVILVIVTILMVINCIVSPVFRFHRYRYKIDDIRDRKNIDSTCLQMTKQNVSAILAQMEIHRILKLRCLLPD